MRRSTEREQDRRPSSKANARKMPTSRCQASTPPGWYVGRSTYRGERHESEWTPSALQAVGHLSKTISSSVPMAPTWWLAGIHADRPPIPRGAGSVHAVRQREPPGRLGDTSGMRSDPAARRFRTADAGRSAGAEN
jgi:hypothetical protein